MLTQMSLTFFKSHDISFTLTGVSTGDVIKAAIMALVREPVHDSKEIPRCSVETVNRVTVR